MANISQRQKNFKNFSSCLQILSCLQMSCLQILAIMGARNFLDLTFSRTANTLPTLSHIQNIMK